MGNASDFIIENGVLKKYVGPGGDVVIPEGVTKIEWTAFIGNKSITGAAAPGNNVFGKSGIRSGYFQFISLFHGLHCVKYFHDRTGTLQAAAVDIQFLTIYPCI